MPGILTIITLPSHKRGFPLVPQRNSRPQFYSHESWYILLKTLIVNTTILCW